MTRSRKHTPIAGIACASSEKQDKRHANRCIRRAVADALHHDRETMPLLRERSNVWCFAKDGKRWLYGRNRAWVNGKMLRK